MLFVANLMQTVKQDLIACLLEKDMQHVKHLLVANRMQIAKKVRIVSLLEKDMQHVKHLLVAKLILTAHLE